MAASIRPGLDLHEQALAMIRDGRLPDYAPSKEWGGEGSGFTCALCGREISASENEFEIEAAGGIAAPLHLHIGCYAAWRDCVRTLKR